MTATATVTKLKLPPILEDLELKLAKALNANLRIIWPEPDKFMRADQVEEIAKVLVRTKLHERLVNAKIVYLFRPEISSRNEQRLTVSGKASAQLKFLTDLDFVVAFNHKLWLRLTPEQRCACVDHALSACERDPDSGAYSVRLPDVAEYSGVVQRWGLWTPPLRGFGIALESADQFEIFVPMEQFTFDEKDGEPHDQAHAAKKRVERGGK